MEQVGAIPGQAEFAQQKRELAAILEFDLVHATKAIEPVVVGLKVLWGSNL